MRLVIEIPDAPRAWDMTEQEYASFADAWTHDMTRDIVCAVEDIGGKVIGGGP